MILHILIAILAGWIQWHQQRVIHYLIEENRVLKTYLGNRRLRLTDPELSGSGSSKSGRIQIFPRCWPNTRFGGTCRIGTSLTFG